MAWRMTDRHGNQRVQRGISFSGIIDIEVWQGDHDLHWNMFPAEIEGGVGGEQA